MLTLEWALAIHSWAWVNLVIVYIPNINMTSDYDIIMLQYHLPISKISSVINPCTLAHICVIIKAPQVDQVSLEWSLVPSAVPTAR